MGDAEEARLAELERQLADVPPGNAGKKKRQKLRKRIEALQAARAAAAQVRERGAAVAPKAAEGALAGGHAGAPPQGAPGNFVEASCPGCYVAHLDAPWVIGVEKLEPGAFGEDLSPDEVPEISLDPETGLLSVVNTNEDKHKCFNISVGGPCLPVLAHNGAPIEPGEAVDEDGAHFPCVSFVVMVQPSHLMDLCYLSAMPEADVKPGPGCGPFLISDIKTWDPHEAPVCTAGAPHGVEFPLQSSAPLLCSQGAGGQFTHFFPSNFHAVDFECPVGTPVLAVGNGRVVEVRDAEKVEGILTSNLFRWNAILLQLDSGLFIEYVHIRAGSSRVALGERVSAGQHICDSGSVGFSPRPHLHLQATLSPEPSAPTIPLRIKCVECGTEPLRPLASAAAFLEPVAGRWYLQEAP